MEIYIFADQEIMKVSGFSGYYVVVIDQAGWTQEIPVTRVERFCDKEGKHSSLDLTDALPSQI